MMEIVQGCRCRLDVESEAGAARYRNLKKEVRSPELDVVPVI
jgi:hypothetical protein